MATFEQALIIDIILLLVKVQLYFFETSFFTLPNKPLCFEAGTVGVGGIGANWNCDCTC